MWAVIKSGGPVMVPLMVCWILALAYIVERLWVLGRIPKEREAQEKLEEVEKLLREQGERAAAEHCNNGRGVLNFVFASLMKRYDQLMIERREFRETDERIIELAEKGGAGQLGRFMAMQKALGDLKEELILETEETGRAYLGKNLIILSTIGTISPLLGLLGTIVGMIIAFQSIAVAGTGDPKVVAGGIAQALVTTATGLIIAIPTIVAHRYLARRADAMRERIEVYGHAFSNSLLMAGQGRMEPAE